jgi:antitoxin (DNA-binding transcriptional repressor) of toxin-antitoxin stability system
MEPLQCNIHEAKTRLSQLIQEALKGRDVVIAKSGRPLVRLQVLPGAGKKRAIGRQKDLVIRMAEDFNAALDDFDPYMP